MPNPDHVPHSGDHANAAKHAAEGIRYGKVDPATLHASQHEAEAASKAAGNPDTFVMVRTQADHEAAAPVAPAG